MEGMALGLPAIGARWFGIPDVIGGDGAGIVVEPRDVPALAEAVAALALDPAAYARARAAAVGRRRPRAGELHRARGRLDVPAAVRRGAGEGPGVGVGPRPRRPVTAITAPRRIPIPLSGDAPRGTSPALPLCYGR